MAASKIKINKKILLVLLILFIVFVGIFLYMYFLILSLKPISSKYIQPALSANLTTYGISSYDNGNYWVPYSLISYNVANVSSIYLNTTFFKNPLPASIFVLNPSECYKCGNYQRTISEFYKDLNKFGIPNSMNSTEISKSDLNTLPKDSILVVLNGYMPSYMFSQYLNTNITILDNLLNRGTNILYVGRNFSIMLNGSKLIPNNDTPSYLQTIDNPRIVNTSGFYLKKSNFKFTNGYTYGPFTYINVYNGSIVAFPNVLNAWSSPNDSGYDLARSVSQLFWFPQYSHLSREITPISNKSRLFIQLKTPLIPSFSSFNNHSISLSSMNRGYLRTILTTSKNYTLGKNVIYKYLFYKPNYHPKGAFYMDSKIIPGLPTKLTIMVSLGNHTTNLQSHISIYNDTSNDILNIGLSTKSNIKGNYTFILPRMYFELPPGNYIAKIKTINNFTYATAAFYIPPLKILFSGINHTLGLLDFTMTMGNTSLSNINYTATLNGKYKQNGTLMGGQLTYILPKGSSLPSGRIVFKFNMLSKTFPFILHNTNNGPISNTQIILLGVVAAVVLALITLIKAPLRDDFYIDVPELPPHKTTNIQLEKESVVSTFNKLNSYYHWKYMPLSVIEVRAAISNYIRHNNMPVNLTLNNVDMLLTQLIGNGDVVSADNLYIPKRWIERTGHDIIYLATFKKLRMFLVTHAILFTDLDTSDEADMVISIHGEKHLIIINSYTSKFKKIPVKKNTITYLVFLNRMELYDFSEKLRNSMSEEIEEFRIYKSTEYIKLIDADNPNEIIY